MSDVGPAPLFHHAAHAAWRAEVRAKVAAFFDGSLPMRKAVAGVRAMALQVPQRAQREERDLAPLGPQPRWRTKDDSRFIPAAVDASRTDVAGVRSCGR